MNAMERQYCLMYCLVILMCTCMLSSAVSIKIVTLENEETSNATGTENTAPVMCSSPSTLQNYVQHVGDDAIFQFVQQEYEEAIAGTAALWTVVVDLRRWACPLELKTQGLLAYLSLAPSPCPSLSPYTKDGVVPMTTLPFSYKELLQAVAARSNFTLQSVAFMFDVSGEDHYSQEPLDWQEQLVFQINIRVWDCNITEELKQLTAKTEVREIMVIASSACIRIILAEAARIELLGGRYRWVVYATDGKLPACTSCTDANVIVAKLQDDQHQACRPTPREKLERLADTAVSRLSQLMSSNSSLAEACNENCTSPCALCRQTFMDILEKNTESTLGVYVRREGETSFSSTLTIYKYQGNNSMATKDGEWKSGETMVNSLDNLFPRWNDPIVLRVVTIVEHPFVIRSEVDGQVTYSGYSFDVINKIAQKVGFAVSVKECDGGVYGYLDSETDQWTGCVGNIVRGDADIIVGALTVTADRENVVDFTLPYYDFAGIQIIMRKQTTQIGRFYFADVFTGPAWGCLFGVVLLTALLLLLFDRYSPDNSSGSSAEDKNKSRRFDFKESLWFVIGSLTMAGGGEAPPGFPARLLVAGFWFFSVIMMSTFTANLAAFLTVSRLGVSITSLEDLASQSDFKYSVVRQSSVMDYFKRMADIEQNFYNLWKNMTLTGNGASESFAVWHYPLGDKYDKIWKSIQETGMMNSTEQAMQRVSQGNFAFLSESPVVKYMTARDCDLVTVGDQFSIRPYAFALKERSIYTKRISTQILELQQTRELEIFKRKWWDDGTVECPEVSADSGLDLSSVVGSYVVVAIGLGSGFLFLVLELIWARCKARKAKNVAVTTVKPMVATVTGSEKLSQTSVQTLESSCDGLKAA